jgi:hypothetical protein
MSHNLELVEATRTRFRPERITTLFVGESAPDGGDFFYFGGNAMLRDMQRAVEQSLGEGGDILARFKDFGWYLDDLVLTPVDKLPPPERIAKCRDAQQSLAARIAEYRPLAIVSLLKRIEKNVDAAAVAAGSDSPRFAVPFSRFGNLPVFLAEMARIIPILPRLSNETTLSTSLLSRKPTGQ